MFEFDNLATETASGELVKSGKTSGPGAASRTWHGGRPERRHRGDAQVVSHLRPIDQWFIDQILPLESMLLASARKLAGDADAARDLVQDAFMRVLAVEGFAAIEAPHPYMLRMMKNLSIQKLRRARIARFEQLSMADGFDLADEAPDAFQVVAGREQLARLKAALAGLPERCRQVFVMRRIEERSPQEIARRLGVSPSTLEKRLARAHYLIARALAVTPARAADDDRASGGGGAPVRTQGAWSS